MGTITKNFCDSCGVESEKEEIMPGQVPGWYSLEIRKFGYEHKSKYLLCEDCAEKTNRVTVEGFNSSTKEQFDGEWGVQRNKEDVIEKKEGHLYDEQPSICADCLTSPGGQCAEHMKLEIEERVNLLRKKRAQIHET